MRLRCLGFSYALLLSGWLQSYGQQSSNPAEIETEQSESRDATSAENASRVFVGRLTAAKAGLTDAQSEIRDVLKEEIDRTAEKGSDEQLRLRVAESEFFEKTGFVPAASPKWKTLRTLQRTASEGYRRALKTMAKEFPEHRDEVLREVLDFAAKYRVDLTGTWAVKYPPYAVSRPYTFVDNGEVVLVSSEGHEPTRLAHSSGELRWDKEHVACAGEIAEVFTDNPREIRGTLRIEVLDPNTLEVMDWSVDFNTGEKKRVRLRYHRLE